MDVQFQLSNSLFPFFCFFYSHEKAELIAYASTLCALNFRYQSMKIRHPLCQVAGSLWHQSIEYIIITRELGIHCLQEHVPSKKD